MSLINDALKRAKQTHKQRLPNPPGGPPLQPHDSNHGSSKSVLLILIAALALGGAGYWYYSGKNLPFHLAEKFGKTPPPTNNVAKKKTPRLMIGGSRSNNAAGAKLAAKSTPPGMAPKKEIRPEPAPLAAPPNSMAAATPTPTVRAPETALQLEESKPPAPAPIPASAQSKSPAPAEPLAARADAPEKFPNLKLQGIYFRYPRPSVLINGKTLFRGDHVDGARIVEIERHQVKLEFGDQTKVLTLQ